jgi:hypothetical protein
MRVIAGFVVAAFLAAPHSRAQGAVPQPAPPAVAPAAGAPAAPLASEPEVLPAPGTCRLLVRDGRLLVGRLLRLQGEELLLEAEDDGATLRVPLADLVSLAQRPPEAAAAGSGASTPAAGQPAADLLDLAVPSTDAAAVPRRTGDRLVGTLLGGDADGLSFQLSAAAAPVQVPFEAIERLLPHASGPLDRLALLPGSDTDDRLWRAGKDGTPDSLTGVVQRLSATEVVFEGALGTLQFPIADVLALVFAPEARRVPPLPGTHVVVRLADGSRLDAGLLEWSSGLCVLATRFAERLELPADAVVSLVRRDGAVTLLADLPPARAEQWPTFGTPEDFLFPWRRDLSVTGRLLALGGLARATGLGVHSNSRLAFTVPPGPCSLVVTAGLCAEVGELPARGSVSFELRVNGTLVASSGTIREGEPARTLRVPGLRGGETLECFTGDGGDDDAGDRAAWVDGIFIHAPD